MTTTMISRGNAGVPCVRHIFFGGTEDVDYANWSELLIQDLQVAHRVARDMLETPGERYVWDSDEPQFYSEFEIIDADEFYRQMVAELLREEG
jgi:hypothetical protein